MRKVAFVKNTEAFGEDYGNWFNEAKQLKQRILQRGWEVDEVFWNDEAPVNWSGYRAIYIGAVGNPKQYRDFELWCEEMARLKARVFNGPQTLKFFTSKAHYLKTFSRKKLPIIPTFVVENPVETSNYEAVVSLAKKGNWRTVVVKPAVATFGMQNYRVNVETEPSRTLVDEIEKIEAPFLVQKFMPNLVAEGEISFLFYGGTFSHAALKVSADKAEHRVNSLHGGRSSKHVPSENDLSRAYSFVQAIAELTAEPVYKARIDMIRSEASGQLELLEIELGDPGQFFATLNEAEEQQAIDSFLDASGLGFPPK